MHTISVIAVDLGDTSDNRKSLFPLKGSEFCCSAAIRAIMKVWNVPKSFMSTSVGENLGTVRQNRCMHQVPESLWSQ